MLNKLARLNTIKLKILMEQDWWIKIRTANPLCIYYFGDFDSFNAAASAQHGYILDLLNEEARILSVEIKQYQPKQLTVVLENEALQPL